MRLRLIYLPTLFVWLLNFGPTGQCYESIGDLSGWHATSEIESQSCLLCDKYKDLVEVSILDAGIYSVGRFMESELTVKTWEAPPHHENSIHSFTSKIA